MKQKKKIDDLTMISLIMLVYHVVVVKVLLF